MKQKTVGYFNYFCLLLSVYVLLFSTVLNTINFQSNSAIVKLENNKCDVSYTALQQSENQKNTAPINKKQNEDQNIHFEEEVDFFTPQPYPPYYYLSFVIIQSNDVSKDEKFIELFHPELLVPPPKI
jgi:primosomal protein N'